MIVALAVLPALVSCAGAFDRALNEVYPDPIQEREPIAVDERFVVDLHADTLLWPRSFLTTDFDGEGRAIGHVDLERLQAGRIGLQVLSVVTKYPLANGLDANACHDGAGFNPVGLLTVLSGRPFATWFDLKARALEQAARLRAFAAETKNGANGTELRLIENFSDLKQLVADRAAGKNVIGALLALEGLHWVGVGDREGRDIAPQIQALFGAGFRMASLTHHFDNALGGSSTGCAKPGLTKQGRIALSTMQDLGMIVDFAHASPALITDALDDLKGPFVVSHTGVQAICGDNACLIDRNLSDEQVVAIADGGGVIGIGFWPDAVGWGADRIILAMEEVRDQLDACRLSNCPHVRHGHDHIAFGSDFDGAVKTPLAANHMPALVDMLETSGAFSSSAVDRIAGINACIAIASQLPGGDAERGGALCSGEP